MIVKASKRSVDVRGLRWLDLLPHSQTLHSEALYFSRCSIRVQLHKVSIRYRCFSTCKRGFSVSPKTRVMTAMSSNVSNESCARGSGAHCVVAQHWCKQQFKGENRLRFGLSCALIAVSCPVHRAWTKKLTTLFASWSVCIVCCVEQEFKFPSWLKLHLLILDGKLSFCWSFLSYENVLSACINRRVDF